MLMPALLDSAGTEIFRGIYKLSFPKVLIPVQQLKRSCFRDLSHCASVKPATRKCIKSHLFVKDFP